MSRTSSGPSFDSAHISIPLGIIIGLLASFVQSLGLTIQRKSHVINQSLPKHEQRVEHRRPLWLLGFAIFILSNLIGSLIQIASLPVVILAPLGAVSLLWNAFFARLILGDVFSPWMIIGTILIAGGAVLIAVFGIVPEPTHSLDDLLELFRRPAFVVYFSLLGAAVFVCLAATHIGEISLARRTAEAPEGCSSLHNNADYDDNEHAGDLTLSNTISTISDVSTITEATPLLDRKRNHSPSSYTVRHPSLDAVDRTRILIAISYASISGIISGMCLIFAKSGVELLMLTIGGKNQFRRWESWVLLSGLIVFALLQMWYLHKALILANPTLVCPSAFCFYNLSSIVNGLVYFNQVQLIKPLHLVLVSVGIIVLLGGVWAVSIHSGGGGVDVGSWNEEAEDVIDEEEETALSTSEAEQEEGLPRDTRPQASDSDSTVTSIPGRKPFGPIPIARHTLSEPLQPTSATTSNALETDGSQVIHFRREHRHTMYSSRPLLSPPSFRTRFGQRRPTITSDTQRFSAHQRNATQPSNAFSPPLNTTVSTLGAGLQIGLSPISPGFSIVPKERKRKISGLGAGDGEPSLRPRERRSVSEGTFRGSLATERMSLSDPILPMNRSAREGPPEDASPRLARQRWGWVRSMFSRSRGR